MPLNYTPLAWKNVDPLNKDQMKVFLQQLSDFLNSAFNPAFLSFALNGQGLLNPGSMSSAANTLIGNNTGATAADAGLTTTQVLTMLNLKTVSTDLGTVSTNQTVNCANAAFIAIRMAISTSVSLSLTLTNVVTGAYVTITFHNGAGTSQVFSVACTGAVTAVRWKFSGSALVAMDSTGTTIASGGDVVASGSVIGTTALYQVAN